MILNILNQLTYMQACYMIRNRKYKLNLCRILDYRYALFLCAQLCVLLLVRTCGCCSAIYIINEKSNTNDKIVSARVRKLTKENSRDNGLETVVHSFLALDKVWICSLE